MMEDMESLNQKSSNFEAQIAKLNQVCLLMPNVMAGSANTCWIQYNMTPVFTWKQK